MRGRDGNWKRNSCAAVCHLRPSLAMYHAVAITPDEHTRKPASVSILNNVTHVQQPKAQMGVYLGLGRLLGIGKIFWTSPTALFAQTREEGSYPRFLS